MNYGQPVQSNSSGQPANNFPTPNVGTNQEPANVFSPENNLDLSSNGAATWGQTPERDTRKIGSEIIASSAEVAINTPETPNETPNQIINPAMPPGYPQIEEPSNNNEDTIPDSENVIDFSSFKEAKNKAISKETLEATTKAVHKFDKGEIGPAELGNLKWDATKAYLKNSFGRELAAWLVVSVLVFFTTIR